MEYERNFIENTYVNRKKGGGGYFCAASAYDAKDITILQLVCEHQIKWKTKNTTLSEQFQNQISKLSYFLCLVQIESNLCSNKLFNTNWAISQPYHGENM